MDMRGLMGELSESWKAKKRRGLIQQMILVATKEGDG
jgi:hypothetical protein